MAPAKYPKVTANPIRQVEGESEWYVVVQLEQGQKSKAYTVPQALDYADQVKSEDPELAAEIRQTVRKVKQRISP